MLESGDMIRTFVDNPGQIQSDWIFNKTQYNYIPFDKEGDTLTGTNGFWLYWFTKTNNRSNTPTKRN